MKSCDYYGMNIQLYLDKELTAQDLKEFHSHLKECQTCRTELEAEEALSGLLHRSRPLYSAPVVLSSRCSAQPNDTDCRVQSLYGDTCACPPPKAYHEDLRTAIVPVQSA
jgi:anti-sigma factor (TIGR02949 family)